MSNLYRSTISLHSQSSALEDLQALDKQVFGENEGQAAESCHKTITAEFLTTIKEELLKKQASVRSTSQHAHSLIKL